MDYFGINKMSTIQKPDTLQEVVASDESSTQSEEKESNNGFTVEESLQKNMPVETDTNLPEDSCQVKNENDECQKTLPENCVKEQEIPAAEKCIRNSQTDESGGMICEVISGPVVSQMNTNISEDREKQDGLQNDLASIVEKLTLSQKDHRQHKSEVIVKNNSQSLKCLLVYGDGDESDNDENNTNHEIEHKETPEQKETSSSSSDSESDSDSDKDSSSVCSEIDSDSSSESESVSNKNDSSNKACKTGTPYFEDPPSLIDLSELEVDYQKETFTHVGEICAIIEIEKIVTVTTISGTPVHNIGTILFIDSGDSKKPFGEICDVIGQVSSPTYCVGFKSIDEMKELGIEKKMKVYSAPTNSKLSLYVFLKDLLAEKHTDALSGEESSSDEEVCDKLPQKRKSCGTILENGNHSYSKSSRGRGRGRRNTKYSNMAPVRQYQTPVPFYDPSVPPPLYQNNSSWNNNPRTNAAPPQFWSTPPYLRTPPPYQRGPPPRPDSNTIYNAQCMPPPATHTSFQPLGFSPRFPPPSYRQNFPSSDIQKSLQ
nr:H/ACA ribonucleoprotein complex non-core subunit NAF1 isoform X2 [Leptinotarsa decemlineata]